MKTSGVSKLDLKRQNRMQILKLLRNEGPTSRIDIAESIKITKAAVTIIANEMIEQNVIYEKGEQLPRGNKVSRGRKKILLDINPTYKTGLGLVVDSGKISFGLCTLKGDVIERKVAEMPANTGVFSEEAFELIKTFYEDIVYKNDLKPIGMTGLGVCIAEEYHKAFGITRSPEDEPDYSILHKRLQAFVRIPMIFDSLIAGVATAEIDYLPDDKAVVHNMLVFRYAREFSCSMCIDQEIYRGSRNRTANIAHWEVADFPVCSCGKTGCVNVFFSREHMRSMLEKVYSQEKTPRLYAYTEGNINRIDDLFNRRDYIPQDAPVRELFEMMADAYIRLFHAFATFLDPDKIILFGEGEGFEATIDYVMQLCEHNHPLLAKGLLKRSKINKNNLFLAASALVTREFFINKGGF